MGVSVTASTLAQAPISAIHYAKNIPLTDGSIPYHYIQKIKEANIKLSLDVNQTDYRNAGHSYRWHCNSYEVVFYDKIKDLEQAKKSDKRSLEKDNGMQLSFFDIFKKRKNFEILRMEVRLNKRPKIKQLFNSLAIKSDLNFKSLFKPAIARKVLMHYIDELEHKRPLLLDYKADNDTAFLMSLIHNNPQLSPQRIMQLYGIKQALKLVTLRELRTLFAKYNTGSWYRLMSQIADVNIPTTENPFAHIREQLTEFKPLKLAIYYPTLSKTKL